MGVDCCGVLLEDGRVGGTVDCLFFFAIFSLDCRNFSGGGRLSCLASGLLISRRGVIASNGGGEGAVIVGWLGAQGEGPSAV